MDAGTLNDAILAAGCPTITTRVIDPNDRATWSFDPTPEATPEQIDAGNNVIETIPIEPETSALPVDEFISRWTNAEYLLLLQQRAADTADGKVGNAKNWDQVVLAGTTININKQKTQTLKDDLVADGILTQSRADEIFR